MFWDFFSGLTSPWVFFPLLRHGRGGSEAYGRHNHDRSFDAHLSILDEGKYQPAISVGLRDFIGTGVYSSEYIVSSKTLGKLELTAGLGFGRLALKNSFTNPLKVFSSKFETRDTNKAGVGGTLGTVNWFRGNASAFYGLKYNVTDKILLSAEYTPDLMLSERAYMDINRSVNFGASYQANDYLNLAAHYLYGSQVSLTANITVNPNRPPLRGGKELAPVPMRLRDRAAPSVNSSNEIAIRRVLAADNFEIHKIEIAEDSVRLAVTNTKFRSIAQAVGRISSTLQRFTSDKIKTATISFHESNLQTGSYTVDLDQITKEQFGSFLPKLNKTSINAVNIKPTQIKDRQRDFSWAIGPYITHRLFNPDLPLSVETGIEVNADYQLVPGLKIRGAIRKSVLTNLTDNKRRSNSVLPRVHSDWPLYDFAGQKGIYTRLNSPISKI